MRHFTSKTIGFKYSMIFNYYLVCLGFFLLVLTVNFAKNPLLKMPPFLTQICRLLLKTYSNTKCLDFEVFNVT